MRIVDNLPLKSAAGLKKTAMRRPFLTLLLSGLVYSSCVYADDIPVDRVILSTSGLAQFEHHTQITGDATVEFPDRERHQDAVVRD